MTTDRDDRTWLTVAGVSAAVVALSIVSANIIGGESGLPEVVWLLIVPIGMFGAGVVCVVSLGMALARAHEVASGTSPWAERVRCHFPPPTPVPGFERDGL